MPPSVHSPAVTCQAHTIVPPAFTLSFLPFRSKTSPHSIASVNAFEIAVARSIGSTSGGSRRGVNGSSRSFRGVNPLTCHVYIRSAGQNTCQISRPRLDASCQRGTAPARSALAALRSSSLHLGAAAPLSARSSPLNFRAPALPQTRGALPQSQRGVRCAAGEGGEKRMEGTAEHVTAEEVTVEQVTVDEDGAIEGGAQPWWNEGWAVPWSGTATAVGMGAWISSFIFVGVLVQFACLQLGWAPWRGSDLDEQALFLLLNQSARTATGVGIVWAIARPHKPLPEDLLHWGLSDPLSLRRGWFTWSLFGIVCAGGVVFLTAAVTSAMAGGVEAAREDADALVQVLPIIAASSWSTAALVTVAGVMAPVLEETIFRGFLLTSLTKWLPVPLAILLSACAFSAAHLTPNEFPKLAALGLVLGVSYVRTRNLLTPMLIHSMWNSGVIIILTLLRLQGYDLEELI